MTGRFDLTRLRGARPASPVVRRIVQRALADGTPRQSPKRLVFAGAVIAAVVLLLLLAVPPRPRTPPVGSTPKLATGTLAQAKGDELRVAAGRHGVEVAAGGAVRAARVEAVATELRVERGRARFSVAHLLAGERFRVEAGAVVIEAVGTQFTVEFEEPCARVQVSEGTVRVQRTGRAPELQSVGGPRTYCAGPSSPEVFSEEEHMLSDALARIRRGAPDDLAAAAASLREYHEQFPEGIYSQEALYYLARIAARLDRQDEARQWARLFLARFPEGTRADELKVLAR